MPSSSSKGGFVVKPHAAADDADVVGCAELGAEKEVEEEAAAEQMSKDMKGLALGFEEEEREGWNGAVGRRRFWVVPVDGLLPEGKITGGTLKPFDMVGDLTGIRFKIKEVRLEIDENQRDLWICDRSEGRRMEI
ncbi:hypothetical protein Vadar_007728 [Vaccinium darrowii]|nr:hypothetical protein Vadar_007728 [Vaccinium darrowii]